MKASYFFSHRTVMRCSTLESCAERMIGLHKKSSLLALALLETVGLCATKHAPPICG